MNFDFDMLSLNVRGIRDYKKSKKVFHWVCNHGGNKGISFLQETHGTVEIENDWRQRFRGEMYFSHGNSKSKGVAILIGSNLDYTMVDHWTDNEGRLIILQCIIQGNQCLLVNTYFPNTEREQVTFMEFLYEKLESIIETSPGIPIIWGGDFNFVTNLNLEAKGGNPKLKLSSIEQLNAIKEELDLCDIWRIRNPDLKRFTWRGSGQGKVSNKHETLHRRLDLFLISDHMQSSVIKSDIIVAPSTDHSALSLKFRKLPKTNHGPSFWKINNALMNDIEYVEKIRKVIEDCKSSMDDSSIVNPNSRWEFLKYEMRKASLAYSKSKARKDRNFYEDLENQLKKIECEKDWSDKEVLVKKYDAIKAQLEERSNYITEGLILRSKVQWVEQGEKSTKYFLNLEKRRKSKTHVRSLIRESNVEITEPKAILERLSDYYKNIYSSKNSSTEEECLQFISQAKTNKLDDNERNRIEGKLTFQECYQSLREMGNNKTPGNDGLSKEFYLTFWHELGHDMVKSLNYSFENGELSITQRQVLITLLEKPEKDVRFVENWRPISLINVDVKVCSKALANRIKELLPKLIHPNQAAFVEGRNISDPLRFISDFMEFSDVNDLSSILFAADFQKAFDSVEHSFIWATLKHFGFGDDFIKWIRLLLTGSRSCVQNNGSVSDFFELKRGTKQGDPISPYLFLLVIEVLAQMIRDNPDIKGFNTGDMDSEIKLVMFADDATFTLQDIESVKECLRVLNMFKRHSSLELNLNKSEIGFVGPPKNKELLPKQIKKKIDFRKNGIRILGIYFSHNQEWFKANNYERVFEKFKAVLQVWKMRKLTLFGKVTVVRTLALSQLLFVFGNLYCPPQYILKIKEEITNFIWNGKKPKIKYDTLISDYSKGGINLPDFESVIKANRVGWAKKVMTSSENEYWRAISIYSCKLNEHLSWGENFDSIKWKQMTKTSKFYEEIAEAWNNVSKTTINNRDDVLRQGIWFNRHLSLQVSIGTMKNLIAKRIYKVSHVWKGTKPDWDVMKTIGWRDEEYLVWRSILNALPKEWREKLREIGQYINTDENNIKIELSGKMHSVDKLSTKLIYGKFISQKQRVPTAQKNIETKVGKTDIEWSKVYSKIYQSTIDVKLRAFQYKIVNNCLYLNEKLYLFKKVESPKCSFCSEEDETPIHFFVECRLSKIFYSECQNWLANASITLPSLNIESIFLGSEISNFQYFLFLLWKYTIYGARNKGIKPQLKLFQSTILTYEKIEYIIAKKKSKLISHLKKYEDIRAIL